MASDNDVSQIHLFFISAGIAPCSSSPQIAKYKPFSNNVTQACS